MKNKRWLIGLMIGFLLCSCQLVSPAANGDSMLIGVLVTLDQALPQTNVEPIILQPDKSAPSEIDWFEANQADGRLAIVYRAIDPDEALNDTLFALGGSLHVTVNDPPSTHDKLSLIADFSLPDTTDQSVALHRVYQQPDGSIAIRPHSGASFRPPGSLNFTEQSSARFYGRNYQNELDITIHVTLEAWPDQLRITQCDADDKVLASLIQPVGQLPQAISLEDSCDYLIVSRLNEQQEVLGRQIVSADDGVIHWPVLLSNGFIDHQAIPLE